MQTRNQSFETLPEEIKKLVLSPEIGEQIKALGDRHSLHIDQIGELASETRMVLIGMSPSKDFIPRIIDRLEISEEIANALVTEINELIFSRIREALQKVQDNRAHEDAQSQSSSNNAFISKVEQAGGFTIEQQPQTLESTADMPTSQQGMNRDSILNGIENPSLNKGIPINVLDNNSLADHMLSGTVAKPMTTTEIRSTPAPATPPAPPKQSPDPYREPIA